MDASLPRPSLQEFPFIRSWAPALFSPRLSLQGSARSSFPFVGFLPRKPERAAPLSKTWRGTVLGRRRLVFYELRIASPIPWLTVEMIWGPDCRVVLARELTKLHEEFLRSTVQDVRNQLAARESIRGEMVLLLDAHPLSATAANPRAACKPTSRSSKNPKT